MPPGRIVQISVSQGGVPKLAVPEAEVTLAGVVGDRQADVEAHGGPDRALCLYSKELLDALAAAGHPVGPGVLGENVTVEGIDWARVTVQSRVWLGEEVLLEVTRPAAPCKTIAHGFSDGRFDRISPKLHPGQSRLYCRVLRGGRIRQGDPVRTDEV